MAKRKPRPDDLVVIPGWERYLSHVNQTRDKLRQRVSQVNLHLTEFRKRTRDLSLAEVGAYVAVLQEYADSPLLEGEDDARGWRECRYRDALAAVQRRRGGRESHLIRLLDCACVTLSQGNPRNSHLEQSRAEQSRAGLSRAEPYVDDDGYVVDRST